jgi:hypothetical protein
VAQSHEFLRVAGDGLHRLLLHRNNNIIASRTLQLR